MPSYSPLYDAAGKRDKARRYIDDATGEIISRRQHIRRTEGVTPEEKAKIPTVRRRKGKKPKNKLQLAGTYRLIAEGPDGRPMRAIAEGYSTARERRNYPEMHEEAVAMAIAQTQYETEMPSGAWSLHSIIHESWFKF